MAESTAPQGLVILFDDEREFVPGFRDDAVIVRSVDEAKELFDELKINPQPVAELWLDYVLKGWESTDQALSDLPGGLVERVIYCSSSSSAFGLLETILKEDTGFSGELEHGWMVFPKAFKK